VIRKLDNWFVSKLYFILLWTQLTLLRLSLTLSGVRTFRCDLTLEKPAMYSFVSVIRTRLSIRYKKKYNVYMNIKYNIVWKLKKKTIYFYFFSKISVNCVKDAVQCIIIRYKFYLKSEYKNIQHKLWRAFKTGIHVNNKTSILTDVHKKQSTYILKKNKSTVVELN
jgi:hypothetical protein